METVAMVKEAIALADDKKLESAREKILDAEKFLKDDEENTQSKVNRRNLKASFELLRAMLKELSKRMESDEIYQQGRAFAYSLLTSHERQRIAARGNNIKKFLSFGTPSMSKFLEEAEKFDGDPSMPLTPQMINIVDGITFPQPIAHETTGGALKGQKKFDADPSVPLALQTVNIVGAVTFPRTMAQKITGTPPDTVKVDISIEDL
jgi:VWA / Hh  protein intein-like